MTKVLVLSYLYPPYRGPAVQHPMWFVRYLRDYGFETNAIASSVFFGDRFPEVSFSPDVQSLPKGKLGRWLAWHLYHIELSIEYRFRAWDPGYLWSYLYAVPAAARLMKRERVSAIVSSSPTTASHLAALRLKRRFPGVKWVADFQDPLLDNPFRPESKWTRIDRALQTAIFAEADILSANTDTVRELWEKRYPQYRDKMIVTWNGYDPAEAVGPEPLPPGPPVLKYVGSLYGGRKADLLLESLKRLLESGRLKPGDLVLEFLGTIQFGEHAALAAELERQGLIRVLATYVPRAEAVKAAASAHYSLLLDVTGHNTALQVPAKLFDQIRIGRPILAFTPPESPTARILEQSGILHITLTPDASPEKIDAAILDLLRMPAESRPYSEWFRKTFDAHNLVAEMAARIRG